MKKSLIPIQDLLEIDMDTSGLNVILAERLRITFGNDTQEVISRTKHDPRECQQAD